LRPSELRNQHDTLTTRPVGKAQAPAPNEATPEGRSVRKCHPCARSEVPSLHPRTQSSPKVTHSRDSMISWMYTDTHLLYNRVPCLPCPRAARKVLGRTAATPAPLNGSHLRPLTAATAENCVAWGRRFLLSQGEQRSEANSATCSQRAGSRAGVAPAPCGRCQVLAVREPSGSTRRC
jgi:hypothetical protein